MKNKILVLLSAFIFCMTLGLKDAMAAAATDVNCTNPCINSYEIQDGQVATTDIANDAVTNAKIADGAVSNTKILDGAVTTSKIADGAVTDAKITGPVSASKIEKPANVIIVAKSGGDFTSIQAAIDSINPTADNPYLIKVMPGIYVENITLKSNVHLEGAGREVTTIQAASASNNVIEVVSLTNVTISKLTITGGYHGILIRASSSIAVRNNNIKQNTTYGIDDSATYSTNLINGNIISGNGVGIAVEFASSPIISDNYINGNSVYGISNGSQYSVPVTITKNIIMDNGLYGIANWAPYSSTFITHNRVTGHTKDVEVGYTTHYISFNIYDSFTAVMGGGAVGSYNVKSDGTPAPLQ